MKKIADKKWVWLPSVTTESYHTLVVCQISEFTLIGFDISGFWYQGFWYQWLLPQAFGFLLTAIPLIQPHKRIDLVHHGLNGKNIILRHQVDNQPNKIHRNP